MNRREALFYKSLPFFLLEFLERYFRVEVEGLENLPQRGPMILIPNHSGFLGLDALVLSHWVYKRRRRIPRVLLHKLWFSKGVLEAHARKFGFLKASYKSGVSALKRRQILILFPEAERGNFKPTTQKYRLQPFKTGFVRMAEKMGVPIVPVLIIGAEEANINLGQFRVFGNLLPVPLNAFPLPAKWKIKFLKPIRLEGALTHQRHEAESQLADALRKRMQKALDRELARREFVYFPKPHF